MMFAVVAALIALGGIAAFLLIPKGGNLLVTVAGPGNRAVDKVVVSVDGVARCNASPCTVQDLSPGAHVVSVGGDGYDISAQQAVKIEPGEVSILNVTVDRTASQTGIRVTTRATGLDLFVDDKNVGPVPQEIRELEPGEHRVRLVGERYEAYEKIVNLTAGQMLTLEPKLKVIKGIAHISEGPNAYGARVVLVSGFERRPIPSLPISVDISTDKSYKLVATKTGYPAYEQPISFADGEAEKSFVIEFGSPSQEASSAPSRSYTPSRGRAGGGSAASTPRSGNGTLNINSIPPSNVVLDGRPLGSTPKVGVSVSPGAHTVVFIHPQLGRKVQQVSVEAGGRASALVRF